MKPRRLGTAARGYEDTERSDLPKVSVAWPRWQLEAINRRVIRNNSTFAKEARRLMEVALAMDHQEDIYSRHSK